MIESLSWKIMKTYNPIIFAPKFNEGADAGELNPVKPVVAGFCANKPPVAGFVFAPNAPKAVPEQAITKKKKK